MGVSFVPIETQGISGFVVSSFCFLGTFFLIPAAPMVLSFDVAVVVVVVVVVAVAWAGRKRVRSIIHSNRQVRYIWKNIFELCRRFPIYNKSFLGGPFVMLWALECFSLNASFGTFQKIVPAKDSWCWSTLYVLAALPFLLSQADASCIIVADPRVVTSRYNGRTLLLITFIWQCLEWCCWRKICICEDRVLVWYVYLLLIPLLLLGWSEVVVIVALFFRLSWRIKIVCRMLIRDNLYWWVQLTKLIMTVAQLRQVLLTWTGDI